MSDHEHKYGIVRSGFASTNPEDPDNHPPTAEERELREYPLDIAAANAKAKSGTGKQYWRSIEELAGDPHFEDLLHREFPRAASEWDESVDRRGFLKLLGASMALAGMAGCGRPPEQHIVPYVKQPDGLILGKPQQYATVMPFGADAVGVLVESHEGRPTKIEGNPDHPSSLGATDAFAQAAILDLYDPDRAKTPTEAGDIRTWAMFQQAAQDLATAQKSVNGAGMRILTGTITSPVLAAQIEYVLKFFPQAKWHQWEPAISDGAREGAKLAFGRYVNTVCRVEKANVILSLDADFMANGPGHTRYMKDFYKRRNLTGPNDEMNRLYAVEPTPSVTGSAADHRLPLRASEIELFARAIAAKLDLGGSATLSKDAERFADAVAKDLQKNRGASLVVAGEQQSAEVHALAHVINAALGNAGATVYYTEPVEANPVNHAESLHELAADIHKSKVDLLLILGGNPVYDAPRDWAFSEFEQKLKKVHTVVHVSSHYNETSEFSRWHIPETHFLETWGDARAFDGTYSVIQPLIAPLYQARSAFEVLAAFTDKPGVTSYDALREHVKTVLGAGDAEKNWRKSLNDGLVAGTALAPLPVSAKFSPASLPPAKAHNADEFEFIFRPDPTIYDGRFANNGWLQELAKPITKITWDNAALVSPVTAQKLGIGRTIASRGGEHGQVRSSVVDIELSNGKVSAAAWVVPGQADGVVVLPLGYGRKNAGETGTNKGFNAYAVRGSNALWATTGGKVTVTNDEYPIACTQFHHNVEGRKIVSSASLEEYKKNPNFAHEKDETPPNGLTLYQNFEELGYYKHYKWAMAIDLTKCNGCNACVVACQSENNIPVVGKDQVMRGREMHWIRIDRYYESGLETEKDDDSEIPALANPPTYFQPVPCQQCENAPCEQVCPVGATTHSAEGLNDMVYNRCIGTRYCSNNCPYKVRRFNFLRFQDWETPSLKLMRNPEVTVRSRGVMEKCTYCVQRINNVRIESEKDNGGVGREIRDGEIVTACEQACPSEAIVFGNANDPNSRVSKLREKVNPRAYNMLGELNARPRTTYLGAVRNLNSDLEKA
ncbi:MAG TPA: TAT-variant-translocated molybdopterin oxidoreductase [Candidatus Dormibacteraeota bacterium]|jgi:MoCo/4Fe-4S cofactor protein with predicted Tat translocation signal|nr:TAT-variant-translocated molybdopterin oxidoreductase [Candidatus Dormibacteraeota bacterium]